MDRSPARRRRIAATLALVSVLSTTATGLVFAAAVHTAAGQRIDDAARGGASLSSDSRAFSATERLLETISVSSLALFGLGIMGVALLRGRPGSALGAGVVVLGANLTTQAMKSHLDRPDLVGDAGLGPGAFPSGHVTVAMSLAMGLVLVAPAALRWTATLAGCTYATGVGIAVVALDWHRPSEVVGGYLVTIAWTAAVAALIVASDDGAHPVRPKAGRAGAVGAALLGLTFAGVVGASVARRLDVVQLVDDRTALAFEALATAASCAALGAMIATLLQRAEFAPPADSDR